MPSLDVPLHGLDLDPVVLVLVAVASIPLAEAVRALAAVALGDPTPRLANRLWRVDRNLHVFGGVITPALLALVGGVVVGWPSPVPVADAALSRPRRVLVALAGPLVHLALAVAALVVPGDLGAAITQVNLLTAALLLVPAPPLPGGAVLAALVPPLAERGSRWDRLRRTDTTPWLLGVLAVVVALHTLLRAA